MRHTLVRTAVTGLAALALSAGLCGAVAQADPGTGTTRSAGYTDCYVNGFLDVVGTGVNIRESPTTASKSKGSVSYGHCWSENKEVDGQSVWCSYTGSYINRWSYGIDPETLVYGYINWCYLGLDV